MPARITPLPIPTTTLRGLRHVIVYGGSFDPPHAYHIEAPARACVLLGLAPRGLLLYVPAAQSPLKASQPIASDSQRVEMLRGAIESQGAMRSCVWTDELDRSHAQQGTAVRPSYMIQTITRLRKILPAECEVRLLIGVDQALVFHKWKDARRLERLTLPLVLPRQGIQTPLELATSLHADESARSYWGAEGIGRWCQRLAPAPLDQTSSTRMRAKLAGSKRERAAARAALPTGVRSIIDRDTLYT